MGILEKLGLSEKGRRKAEEDIGRAVKRWLVGFFTSCPCCKTTETELVSRDSEGTEHWRCTHYQHCKCTWNFNSNSPHYRKIEAKFREQAEIRFAMEICAMKGKNSGE